MAKYFLIAGEASGDIHAASLVEQIRQRDPEALFIGLGGDRMAAAGVRLVQHIRLMAYMGYVEVIKHSGQIRRNFRLTEQALLTERPDVLILIDYPSFNLRIAAFCRKHLPDTRITYYIPPKVWAWKRRRIHTIARLCDRVLGIFPFEPDFYAQYGYQCTYVGNPTAEVLPRQRSDSLSGLTAQRSVIAILPGSRPFEIHKCLPKMLSAARRFQDYRIVVCAAPGISDEAYLPLLREGETLTRDTYAAVREARAAIVNSGTATLETALLHCPQVAVYQVACPHLVGLILRFAHSLIFSIPYFTLVNIITGQETIKECIANRFTVDNIAAELQRLLTDEDYRKKMLASYEHLSQTLGTLPASVTAAELITSK